MKVAHPVIRRRPRQLRAAQTLATLLEAARLVIEERGPRGYNTNAVCERAGVSIGSLYQYFSSKDALTAALIEQVHVDTIARTAKLIDESGSAPIETVLDQIIDGCRESMRRQPVASRFLESEEERIPRSPALLDLEQQILDLNRPLLRRYVRPDCTDEDVDVAALNVIVIVSGMTHAEVSFARPSTLWCASAVRRAVLGYLQPML